MTESIKDSSLDRFLTSKLTTLIFIGSTIIAIYLAFTGLPNNNSVALQLQQQRIDSQTITIESLTKTQQNDTQEVKLEINNMKNEIDELENSITKLVTIIEERIPRE